MSFLKGIISDLRDKRLWPVAALLLIAVLAVPVLLSKSSSSSPTPVAQLPSSPSGGTASGLPAVDVSSAPSEGTLTGKGRNPFTQFGDSTGGTSTTGTTSTTTTSTTGTSTTSGSSSTGGATTSTTASGSGGTGSSGTGSSSTGSSGTGSSGAPSITTGSPKPAPTGLAATESYEVSLAITNASGGLDTYAPLQRLSVLPSPQRPLLVELGVLKGGKRVMFAVQPGAVVDGPGTCVPGPVDCEILSLAPGRTEALGMQTSRGAESVALFAVTDVAAARHASVTAADQARRASSAAGRALLAQSTSGALALFQYEPSIGALVDLRNLGVS